MKHILLTGATGFLGRHTAVRLLRRPGVDRLLCLVRADDEAHGRERLLRSLRRAVPAEEAEALLERIEPLPGDLMVDRLGFEGSRWSELAERTEAILHCAADVRFDRDLDESRRYNVFGTQQVLGFARESQRLGSLRRFDYVSTTFVAGLRRDRVGEHELEHDAGWKNAYEQTKYEAELLLRREAGDLPTTVLRPSIIVGESRTGATTNFGMLYWPLRVYAKGWWRTVVGRAETPLDIVPVDYVADALEALTRPGAEVGGNYHLAAGPDGILTIGELARMTQEFFGGKRPRFVEPKTFFTWVRPVVDLLLWGPKRRVIREGGRFFVPYFDGNPLFDIERSRSALAEHGIAPPEVRDYFQVILDFCRDTDFGKRPPSG